MLIFIKQRKIPTSWVAQIPVQPSIAIRPCLISASCINFLCGNIDGNASKLDDPSSPSSPKLIGSQPASDIQSAVFLVASFDGAKADAHVARVAAIANFIMVVLLNEWKQPVFLRRSVSLRRNSST